VTTAVGVAMCFAVGIVGYLSFRDSTETDILENFSGKLGVVFKLLVVVHLILYTPGDYIILRASLFNIFNTKVGWNAGGLLHS
jgi:amino acid permease